MTDINDLIQRLRDPERWSAQTAAVLVTLREAAAALESLQAELRERERYDQTFGGMAWKELVARLAAAEKRAKELEAERDGQ